MSIFPFAGLLGPVANISYTKELIQNRQIKRMAKENGLDFEEMKSEFDSISKEKPNINNEKYLSDLNKYLGPNLISAGATQLSKTSGLENWLSSDNTCTDGEDDGQISFWSKVGNCIEGAAKTIVGTVYNIVTDPKKLATTILVGIGLALFSCTGIGAIIVPTLGIITGGKLIINGIKTIGNAVEKERNATTDKEAKEAWEDIGEGGTKVVAGAYVTYTSGNALNNVIRRGTDTAIAENEQVFLNNKVEAEFILKTVTDPGNIEVD